MSKRRYFIDESDEDDVLHSLAQTAKDTLQQNDNVVKIYQKYNEVLYGQSPKQVLFLMRLNNKSLFSSRPRFPPGSPKRDRISSSSRWDQAPSTPLKGNPSVSCLPRKDLKQDNEDDKTSQSAAEIQEKYAAPVKVIQSTKHHENLAEKHSAKENADNKESVTASQEKIPIPVKIIQNVTDSEGETRKHLSSDNAHVEASQIIAQDRRKLSSSEKIIGKATDPEMKDEQLPFENKEMESLKPAKFEVLSPTAESTVNTKEIDRTVSNLIENTHSADQKYSSPSAEKSDMATNSDENGKKFSKRDKAVEIASSFEIETKENVHPGKEVQVVVIPTNTDERTINLGERAQTPNNENTEKKEFPRDDEKNGSPIKIARMSSNIDKNIQEFVNPRQTFSKLDKAVEIASSFEIETKENVHPGKEVQVEVIPTNNDERTINLGERAQTPDNQNTEKKEFPRDDEKNGSPIKIARMSSNIDKDIQDFGNPEGMDKTIVKLAESNKLNTTPNQPRGEIKVLGEKRKSPSPRRDTILFRSIPKVIQSSGVIEIEIVSPSIENLSPAVSSPLSTENKSSKTITDSIDKKKLNKDMHFSEDESKAGSSQDLSPSAKNSLESSPLTEVKANSPSSDNVTSLGKTQLTDKSSKGNPPTERRSMTLTSSRTANFAPNTLIFYIMQMNALLLVREAYTRGIFNSVLDFRKDLEFLLSYLNNIANVARNIPIADKDYITEEFKEDIIGLMEIILKLMKSLSSWKKAVDVDILSWTESFEQISNIRSRNEPLSSDGKPLITFDQLLEFEGELKTKWKQMDDMILIADSRRSSFLTTAHDLEKLIHFFVASLIKLGILKLSSEPLL